MQRTQPKLCHSCRVTLMADDAAALTRLFESTTDHSRNSNDSNLHICPQRYQQQENSSNNHTQATIATAARKLFRCHETYYLHEVCQTLARSQGVNCSSCFGSGSCFGSSSGSICSRSNQIVIPQEAVKHGSESVSKCATYRNQSWAAERKKKKQIVAFFPNQSVCIKSCHLCSA